MGVFTDWQPLCSLVGGGRIEMEAHLMQISDDNPDFQDWVIDLPCGGIKNNLWMEEYLCQSNYRLDTIAELANRGEKIDSDSRNWMLSQVDFIVESLGTESGALYDSLRSSLLQLILAIANLNEQIRSEIQCAVEK
jgi:hypothetical protein